jgi:hypothetical protein
VAGPAARSRSFCPGSAADAAGKSLTVSDQHGILRRAGALLHLTHRQAQVREIQLTMPGVAERERIIHHHLRRDRAQPRDRRARLVEQAHMGVASRKITISSQESGDVLYCNPQTRNGLHETPAEEQCNTGQVRGLARLGSGAEPQGPTGMLDRQIRLPSPQPEKTADVPAARVAWIERESAINQRDHRIDVFAETGESQCCLNQYAGSVLRHPDSPSSEIYAFLPDRVSVRSGGVGCQIHATVRREAESRTVVWVAADSLLSKRQRLPRLPFHLKSASAQIGIIGAGIARRAVGRPRLLGRLQRRLDDAGDADSDLLLQLEHVFERAVETVGPQMRPRFLLRSAAR